MTRPLPGVDGRDNLGIGELWRMEFLIEDILHIELSL